MRESLRRVRSSANYYPVYSSDEDEQRQRSTADRKLRRSLSYQASHGEHRNSRKSLVGNKPNEGDALGTSKRDASEDTGFDALFIPKTILFVAFGLAIGLFVAVMTTSLLQHTKPRLEGNHLLCSSSEVGNAKTCIPDDEVDTVLAVIIALQWNLSKQAGLVDCYPQLRTAANLSVNQLDQFFPKTTNVSTELKKYVVWIIQANPSWNLRVLNSTGAVADTMQFILDRSLLLTALHPSRPLTCVLAQWLNLVWHGVWYIVVGLLVVLVTFYSYLWYTSKKLLQERAVFVMVDKIIEVLRSHYKSSLDNKDLLPYLAIPHVRDMLIPPSERVRKELIWQRAVDWIASSESRVRVESRMIAGEQFAVWRWIQSDPPATECPNKYEQWQGKAFDSPSSPSCPPSPCMRLKNMFDSTVQVSSEEIIALQDAVLHKCMDHGRVVHLMVDKRSLFGCVYLKLDSVSSAVAVYKTLHGSWFNGKLITAKYVAPERYHKWFPASEISVRSLFPSDS